MKGFEKFPQRIHQKPLFYKKGRIYFPRDMERKFFFVLTLLMLLWGVLVKLGFL